MRWGRPYRDVYKRTSFPGSFDGERRYRYDSTIGSERSVWRYYLAF